MVFPIKNIEVDLYKFSYNHFNYNTIDFQVIAEYIDDHSYDVIIRRLDKQEGWQNNIIVLAVYKDTEIISENGGMHIEHPGENRVEIAIGTSDLFEKRVRIQTNFEIKCSDVPIDFVSNYDFDLSIEEISISRKEFNTIFDTDIVTLPHSIYAIGLNNGKMYLYNEKYDNYYCIIRSIRLILKTAILYTKYTKFYFLICCKDGYMMHHYNDERYIMKEIGETECKEQTFVSVSNPSEYPIFHKNKYVLGQSNKKNMPYAIDIVDRHYLYHNLYHSFRSFHEGIPFHKKENKIVYGGQNRGNHYNFLKRRDIQITQRDYFRSNSVSKKNVIYEGWIDRIEMIRYKYILDIDGQASTWDATAWKLNSGSVILKTESGWRQWFYDEYLPNVHFIEIKEDFSDLQEKYEWCENHPAECLEMISKCKELFQKIYNFRNIIEYTITVVNKICVGQNASTKIE